MTSHDVIDRPEHPFTQTFVADTPNLTALVDYSREPPASEPRRSPGAM